jgi:hypothetical protein
MNSEGFISLSKSSLFKQLGVNNPTIQGFKTFIVNKKEELKTILENKGIKNDEIEKKTKPEYCGAICLQQLILNKIKTYQKKRLSDTSEKTKILKNRLQYFTSDQFIKHFLESMPTRDDDDKQNKAGKSSYTKFLNDLFNIKYDDWRDDKLSKIDNQTQCRKALRLPSGQNIADLQAMGNTTCYLCGRKIYSAEGISTMECEHILPIISALSHWWLVKEKTSSYNYSQRELDLLRNEYDWSHSCCNRVKSNKDFVSYGIAKRSECKYIVNQPMIQSVLTEIGKSPKHDCPTVNRRNSMNNKQDINVNRRIQPIVDEINKNVEKFDDISQYYLLTKYKLLSALDDTTFMNILINNDGNELKFRPKIDYEKIKEKRELAKQLEKEELIRKMQLIQTQKSERNERYKRIFNNETISRTTGGNNKRNTKRKFTGEIKNANTEEIVDDILTDEDILDLPLDGYDDNVIDDNSTEYIIENILTNNKYGPSIEELETQYYNIFNDHLEYEYEIESESKPKTKGIKLIKSPNSVTRKKRNRSPSLSPIRSIEKTIQMNSPHISPQQDKVYNSSNRTTKKHKKSPVRETNYSRENFFNFIK